MARTRILEDYSDDDEGILSLKAEDVVTLISESGNGWSLLRADGGEEGWFPSGYTHTIQRYIEVDDEKGKVVPLHPSHCALHCRLPAGHIPAPLSHLLPWPWWITDSHALITGRLRLLTPSALAPAGQWYREGRQRRGGRRPPVVGRVRGQPARLRRRR